MELQKVRQNIRKELKIEEVIANSYLLEHGYPIIYIYKLNVISQKDKKPVTGAHKLREEFFHFMTRNERLRQYSIHRLAYDDTQNIYSLDELPELIQMTHGKTQITLKYHEQLHPDEYGHLTSKYAAAYQAVIWNDKRKTEAHLTPDSWYGARTTFVHLPSAVDLNSRLGPNLKLALFQGLYAKVKLNKEGRLVITTALAHRVLEKYHMNVLEYFLHIHGVDHNPNTISNMTFTERAVNQFNNDMRGKPVSTIYAPRHYKIEKVINEYPRTTEFQANDGRVESVEGYLYRRYGVQLQYPNLPLVQMNRPNRQPVLIPMECLQISLRPRKHFGNLAPYLKTILKKVTYEPRELFLKTKQMLETAQIHGPDEDSTMAEFGVTLKKSMLRTKATVLPLPDVQMFAQPPRKRARIVPIYMARDYDNDKRIIEGFLDKLQTQFDQLFGEKRQFLVEKHIEMSDIMRIPSLYEQYKRSKDEDVLLLTFMPEVGRTPATSRKCDLYSDLKSVCNAKLGAPNQCINMITLQGCMQMGRYTDNIVRKINEKLGGKTNAINADYSDVSSANELLFHYGEMKTMFVGVFSSKGTKKDKTPSVHTMAYNIDRGASCYVGVHRYQQGSDDMISDFSSMFGECLEGFADEIGSPPERILVLRNGISESVIDKVAEEEQHQIQDAIQKFRTDFAEKVAQWDPKVCYLDVSRSQSRFAVPIERTTYENLKQGSVIDQDVVESNNDFIMASHEGRLGTTRPAEYSLKFSTWKDQDMLDVQILCNNLCHLLGRSAYASALPAPIRMATSLAKRCRDFKAAYPKNTFDYKKLPLHSQLTPYFT